MSVVLREMMVVPAGVDGRLPHAVRDSARRQRILLLILALVLMSVADLLCTISYLTSFGMVEANPIARHMIAIGGIRQLVLFKAFTMALSCGCIFLVRNKRRAEIGAWLCVGVLFTLMLHWTQYNEVMHTLAPHFSSITIPGNTQSYGEWIMIHE